MGGHISDYDRAKKATLVKHRFVIALMATLCPVVCYMGRQNLSLAITAMVKDPQKQDTQQVPVAGNQSIGGSSTGPSPSELNEKTIMNAVNNLTSSTTQQQQQQQQQDLNNQNNHLQGGSCPRPTTVGDDGRSSEQADAPSFGPKYDWANERSLVLGAFYWTYVFCQIPGARLAESWGAKWILAAATLGTCLFSVVSPLAASWGPYALFAVRFLMGICQAALYPACYVLYAQWSPPSERSNLLPLLGVGAYIGGICAFSSTGYFIEEEKFGWEYAFYLPAVICALWSLIWISIGTSEPRQHKFISLEELEYIESRMEVKSAGDLKKKPISWVKLFSSQHIWAMMVAFFASNWSFTTVLLFLPTYLKDILHVSPIENAFINSMVYALYMLSSPIVGAVSTMMIESRPCGLSRLTIRKLFQGVALFGQGALFLALPWVGCNSFIVKGMFFAMIVLYSFVNGGEVQLPTEMSVDFAGTIYAIGNCVGSSTGFILPLVYGFMVEDYREHYPHLLAGCWNRYFYLTAGVSITGGLIFSLFGRNDMRDFSSEPQLESESQLDISKGSAFNLEEAQYGSYGGGAGAGAGGSLSNNNKLKATKTTSQ